MPHVECSPIAFGTLTSMIQSPGLCICTSGLHGSCIGAICNVDQIFQDNSEHFEQMPKSGDSTHIGFKKKYQRFLQKELFSTNKDIFEKIAASNKSPLAAAIVGKIKLMKWHKCENELYKLNKINVYQQYKQCTFIYCFLKKCYLKKVCKLYTAFSHKRVYHHIKFFKFIYLIMCFNLMGARMYIVMQ